MDQIKLLIVDDHPLFRQGLVDVLETDPGLRVVAQAADGEVAVGHALLHRPDIILMDVNLPNANGLRVTRQILGELPQTKVIILTGYDDAEQVFHALRLGAAAYCSKDIPPEALLNTVYAVYHGGYVVHGQVMTYEEVIEWVQQRVGRYNFPADEQTTEIYTPLSPREMEILEMVTRGASNKEIASQLRISQQTVKNHMTAILRKLHVDDRTQAAVYALRHGWVRLDTSSSN
ncbi:MAG TPA: response regulator transcription factor [Promineifilum sp.]|nr:response regulator transcription factor [Promineifilum sp.]